MPSSTNSISEGICPRKVDQVSSLEMDGQILKHPCRRWDPDYLHGDGDTCSPDKKKSRKHQRFMTRRALEQKRRRSKGKVRPVTSDTSRMGPKQICLPWEACQNDQLLKEDVVKDRKICVPFPSASVPSVSQDRQPTLSQDLMPQGSLPSSSAESMSSLPCAMPKRSKKCVAIDCEMVGTGPTGKTSELARCTVVNYNGDVIYDKYIHPELPIVDYRTQWSGITWRHMVNATPFRVARREILQILRDKIVVGHAIHNDFRALKYFHPEPWTRDTSQSRLLKKKVGLSVKANVSLKSLASQLLCKKIQVSRSGHSSVEDAQTSMELYRLVELQWEEALAHSLCSSPPDSGTDSDCYLDDQYWPKDLNADCK